MIFFQSSWKTYQVRRSPLGRMLCFAMLAACLLCPFVDSFSVIATVRCQRNLRRPLCSGRFPISLASMDDDIREASNDNPSPVMTASLEGEARNAGNASTSALSNTTAEEPLEQISKYDDNDEEEAMIALRIWNFLMTLKEELYAKIRQVFSNLFTIIRRSTEKTEAWIRDDAVGQLVSSALALVAFYAGVAAFAVWNIELLGGKKFSGPSQVIVPSIQVPESSAPKGVKFQKPQWKAPKFTTSYSNAEVEESDATVEEERSTSSQIETL